MMIRVQKSTGTYADSLHAVGLAHLLESLGQAVQLVDTGDALELRPVADEPLKVERVGVGFRYIWDSAKESAPPPNVEYLDYQEQRAKRDAWNKHNQSKKVKRQLAEQDIQAPEPPDPDLGMATIISSMRKGWESDRKLAHWIVEDEKRAKRWLEHRLGLSTDPLDFAEPDFSNTQILNPISGKGGNSSKTRYGMPGSLPGQLVDPFVEWMKWRGLWASLLLYRSDDDFKFFSIEPQDIDLGAIKEIKGQMQRLSLWGGLRLDIEATLRCAATLVMNSEVVETQRPRTRLRGRRPNQVISGLRMAFFKSLGTAPALMNDCFMPLPGWFVIETRADADDFLRLIDEAIGSTQGDKRTWGCLGSLQENNSDDGATLQKFRKWLLSEEVEDLLEFHYHFAIHTMENYSRREWVQPFSTGYLTTLLGKGDREDVKEIIENEGFLNIARALRNATIYAVRMERKEREVRFGLAQRWKQKMKAGTDAFLVELSDFVQAYNWETIDKLDGKGFTIRTEDLNQVLALCQAHGHELVGSLLLAYGYAIAPSTAKQTQENS